jgi:serine/threonine protein kinase, bacterial
MRLVGVAARHPAKPVCERRITMVTFRFAHPDILTPAESWLFRRVGTILPMPLVRGATAAGLHIVRLLGSGQTGELYLAEHPRLPRNLALKVLPDDLSADLAYRHQFDRESNLAAALWHPHIVGIYDRGEFEGRLWLAMDYVDGVDAAHLLGEKYPNGMPPDMVVEIVAAIADALDYAHDQGLLHRYVNPSNILLASSASDRRRILLAGFGIARRLDDVNSLTRADIAIGTASYRAPEELKNEEIDGRADQYSLACTAFHLLTGSPPFAHFNPAVVSTKQLNESPPRPGDIRPELTRFGGTFARALAKEPTDRFRRCQDFARALARGESKTFDVVDAGATAVTAASERNGAAPAQPGVPAAADAEVDVVDEVVAPPDVLRDAATHDASTTSDDAPITSRHRRLLHITALILLIVVVAVAVIVIVIYLRSPAESDDTPTNVEPTSSVAPIAPAPRSPARATPSPAMTSPPPPTVKAPTSTPPPPVTTARTTTSAPPPETTTPPTTKTQTTMSTTPTSSTPTSSSPPPGADSRPAVGMPCGPEQSGTTTPSNLGVPVSCVGTPGGFAWEPPGS